LAAAATSATTTPEHFTSKLFLSDGAAAESCLRGPKNIAPRLASVAGVTFENSPSKVAVADQPFSHFFSAEAVTKVAWVRLRGAIPEVGAPPHSVLLRRTSCYRRPKIWAVGPIENRVAKRKFRHRRANPSGDYSPPKPLWATDRVWLTLTKQETRSSTLLAQFANRAINDPVLERLLLDGGRPTADEHIGTNWMGVEVPKNMDNEEREIIALLKALQKAKD
jgi:hypothetical protein